MLHLIHMARRFLRGVKRFILWDHRRASWQYDVMVGLILAFIFLTPRTWFHDQPRPSVILMLPAAEDGSSAYWLEPKVLAGLPEAEQRATTEALLRSRFDAEPGSVRVVPIFDSEQEIKGYMVYTAP